MWCYGCERELTGLGADGDVAGEVEGEDDKAGWKGVEKELKERGIRWVSWKEWEAIDAEERRRGKDKGKERSKITSIAEMLKVIDG